MNLTKKIGVGLLTGLSVLALASCGNEVEDNTRSYLTVEINPSVEVVLDGDDNVITINGLNDDGKMLINDEEFEGKSVEEILDIIIEEAQACGYLVSSESENAVQRNVSISVSSSDSSHVAELEASVKLTVEGIIDEEKINAAYEELGAKKREHFINIAKKYDPSLTDEEINELSDEQLMSYVELATIEKAELATIEMEKYYLSMKEYEFQFQYKEEIAAKLKANSSFTSTIYTAAINALKDAIDKINDLQYKMFVSEDSSYLKLLNQLNEYKDKNIVLNYKYSKGQTQEDGTEITVVIETNKEQISKIEAEIIKVMNEFNNSLEAIKGLIQEAINTLESLEKKLSSINYDELMTKVETSINDSKNGLLAKFEEEHKDDIEAAKNAVKERKETLESSIVR